MSDKILIINFTFPPYPGIGGRRWAKFAKYLQRDGFEVSVIAAKLLQKKENPWFKDTLEYANNIAYIKPPYPRVMGTVPNNLAEKIKYKLALEFVKIKHGKYNYFDPSSGFGKKIRNRIVEHIKNGCRNIIVSCGPFHMSAEIIALKNKFPGVNFIVDFRDPWANNRTSFGFQTIGEERLTMEKKLELFVIKNYDKVISVSGEMNHYFQQISKERQDKFITIPNGFDLEDMKMDSKKIHAKKDKLQFVFTGTLYNKVQHLMEELVEVLLAMKSANPEVYRDLQFDFFGQVPGWFKQVTAPVQEIIQSHGEVSLQQVYEKISAGNVCTLFLTNDLTYSRSTKFYEYLAAKKPVAVFSVGGGTAEFVENSGAGYACDTGKMREKILAMHSDWRSGKLPVNDLPDIAEHDTKNLVKKIEEVIMKTA